MNGTHAREGRVEVCYDGRYHTVCDDFWDEREARIVCRNLSFTSDGTCKALIMTHYQFRLVIKGGILI